jgi:hypothetical protein
MHEEENPSMSDKVPSTFNASLRTSLFLSALVLFASFPGVDLTGIKALDITVSEGYADAIETVVWLAALWAIFNTWIEWRSDVYSDYKSQKGYLEALEEEIRANQNSLNSSISKVKGDYSAIIATLVENAKIYREHPLAFGDSEKITNLIESKISYYETAVAEDRGNAWRAMTTLLDGYDSIDKNTKSEINSRIRGGVERIKKAYLGLSPGIHQSLSTQTLENSVTQLKDEYSALKSSFRLISEYQENLDQMRLQLRWSTNFETVRSLLMKLLVPIGLFFVATAHWFGEHIFAFDCLPNLALILKFQFGVALILLTILVVLMGLFFIGRSAWFIQLFKSK